MTPRDFYGYSTIVFACYFILSFFLAFPFPKRKHFVLRAVLSFLVSYFVIVFYKFARIPHQPLLNTGLQFLLVFLLGVFSLFASFRLRLDACFFLAIAAYTIRHLVYLLAQVFGSALHDINHDLTLNFYVLQVLVPFAFYVFLSPLLLYLQKMLKENHEVVFPPKATLVFAGFGVLSDVIFNYFTLRYFRFQALEVKYWMYVFNVILCLAVLITMFGYAKQLKVQSQMAVLNQLEYERNRQVNRNRENIELINIKCHDLRHQIRSLKESSSPEIQKELDELEKKIRIYDTNVKTGNDTLDVLLSEKSLFCHKNDITMDCIIDGKQIDFLSEKEICSLFGNIVDNAVESTLRIPDAQKRIITLKIYSKMGGVYITEENPYVGTLVMKKGIPLTDKADKAVHGFGMKSIENVVRQHDGQMKITAENNRFLLQIFFLGPRIESDSKPED